MDLIIISDGKLANGKTHRVEVYDFGQRLEGHCSCGVVDKAYSRDELNDKINDHVNESLKGNYDVESN